MILFLMMTSTVMAQDPSGYWKGGIKLPTGDLGISVEIKNGEEGASGTVDIPSQGMRGAALSELTIKGSAISFKIAGIPGSPAFAGTLAEDGKSIKGTFTQGMQSFDFSLKPAVKEDEPTEEVIVAIPGKGMPGEWRGTLVTGPMKLRLALMVTELDGALSAILNSIDQGAKIPVDSVDHEEEMVTFKIAAIQGDFSGSMSEDGSTIDGTWTQMGQSNDLKLLRVK